MLLLSIDWHNIVCILISENKDIKRDYSEWKIWPVHGQDVALFLSDFVHVLFQHSLNPHN
jgi:hypothetical protein